VEFCVEFRVEFCAEFCVEFCGVDDGVLYLKEGIDGED